MVNLAENPAFAEKLATMQATLVQQAEVMGDFEFPQGKQYWEKKAELAGK